MAASEPGRGSWKFTLEVKCRWCGRGFSLPSTMEQYKRLKSGNEHVQDIYPELTDSQRELLISQTCDKCWTEIFGEEEDD